jgi:AraC-like DNA-binding protein
MHAWSSELLGIIRSSTPPYRSYGRLGNGVGPTAGQVLVATLTTDSMASEALIAELREFRLGTPWAHFLIHVPEMSPVGYQPLLKMAVAAIGAGGFVAAPTPDRTELVHSLAVTHRESEGLLRAAVRDLTQPFPMDIRVGLTAAFGEGASGVVPTGRRWRRFRRAGVPSLDSIRRLRKAIPPVIRLQVQPDMSVLTAALEAGYSDGSSFSRSCDRLFGSRPRNLRALVGVRWAVWSWWQRHTPRR